MRGVTFGNKHSFTDFGMYLKSYDIGFPEPKTETVDVPGMNGVIDLTDVFGEVYYKNRHLSFTFSVIRKNMEWDELLNTLTEYLHGKKMRIILDSDPEHYWYGRCTINTFSTDRRISTITIDCDAEPFKKKVI